MWYPGYDEGTYLKLLESETNRELLACRGRYCGLPRQYWPSRFPARGPDPDAAGTRSVARVAAGILPFIGQCLHKFRLRGLPKI